jgi:hypothetical protein
MGSWFYIILWSWFVAVQQVHRNRVVRTGGTPQTTAVDQRKLSFYLCSCASLCDLPKPQFINKMKESARTRPWIHSPTLNIKPTPPANGLLSTVHGPNAKHGATPPTTEQALFTGCTQKGAWLYPGQG